MLGIAVNEMQRSLGGPQEASRNALFHYQMTHLDPRGPQMRVADPRTGWWSTRRRVPTAAMDRPFRVLPKYPPPSAANMYYDSRDALFHYQVSHQVPWGPQMRVADPDTGWWSTRRVIPYATPGRRFDVLSKVRYRHYGLGDVPSDSEAAIDLQYTPVRQGWFYGEPVQGFPDHHREGDPQVFVGPEALAMLGEAANNKNSSDPALKTLVRVERLQTALQIISTASIAVLATLAVGKAVHFARMRKTHAAAR